MIGSVLGLIFEAGTIASDISNSPWVNIEILVLLTMHLFSMLIRYFEIVREDYEITREEIEQAADEFIPRQHAANEE